MQNRSCLAFLLSLMACTGVAVPTRAVAAEGAPSSAERGARIVRMNNLFGPTGLLTTPTVDVTPRTEFQFGTSFARNRQTVSLNYGFVSGIEIGATYVERDNRNDRIIGNAKVNIIPRNFRGFELGIGVQDAANTFDRTLYLVVSAEFPMPRRLEERAAGLRLHLGAGNGMFQDEIFGGAVVTINRRFQLVGEWDTKNVNAAVRYVHDNAFRVQLGVQDTRAFLGATYALKT